MSTYGRYSRRARSSRWLRMHLAGNRQRYRNWLSRRARTRGKTPLPDRVTRAIGSRVPVYRDGVNPATGRPRRADRSPDRGRDVGSLLSDFGPGHRMIEIDGPDGRPLGRWEGWSLTARGAVANADRLRTDRQDRAQRRARRAR